MVRAAVEALFAEFAVEPRPTHWSHGLPQIFEVEHPEGSLDLETADELIDRYESHGRRPEDLAFLRQFFAEQRNAFGLPTYRALQRYVQEAPLLTGPAWVARVQDGRQLPPVILPTLADLLGGRIDPGAFSQILEHVRLLWFRGDLEAMASAAELETQQLAEYGEGLQLPRRYEQVVRLAHRLDLDADALGYAWIAEMRNRFKLDLEDDPRNALSRAQILSETAGLRLGRLPIVLIEDLSLRRVVETIRQALAAGLEEQAVYTVFTELCACYPQLTCDIGLQAARLGRRRRLDSTSLALRLGSLVLQSQGEMAHAALLEAQAGDAIGRAQRDGFLLDEPFRAQRVRHYEEAMRLYEASGGGNTRWTNEAFARRVEGELAQLRRSAASEAAPAAERNAWFAARPAFSAPELSPVIEVVSRGPRWIGYVAPPAGESATVLYVEGSGYRPLATMSTALIAGASALVPSRVR